jgi:hypothetical protein
MPYYIILMDKGEYWLARLHPDMGVYTKLLAHSTREKAQEHIAALLAMPGGYE